MKKKILCIAVSATAGFLIAWVYFFVDVDWNYTAPIATTIGAFLTLIAIAITFYFSWQNRQMLIEARQAKLIFSIKPVHSLYYVLEMANVGYYPADDIKLRVNQEFIACVSSDDAQQAFRDMPHNPFTLNGGDKKQYYITEKQNKANREQLFDSLIKLNGTYTDRYRKIQIKIDESFYGKSFFSFPSVESNPMYSRVNEIKGDVSVIKNLLEPKQP